MSFIVVSRVTPHVTALRQHGRQDAKASAVGAVRMFPRCLPGVRMFARCLPGLRMFPPCLPGSAPGDSSAVCDVMHPAESGTQAHPEGSPHAASRALVRAVPAAAASAAAAAAASRPVLWGRRRQDQGCRGPGAACKRTSQAPPAGAPQAASLCWGWPQTGPCCLSALRQQQGRRGGRKGREGRGGDR